MSFYNIISGSRNQLNSVFTNDSLQWEKGVYYGGKKGQSTISEHHPSM